jgi:DNA-binding NarL/FixJ family response regulator
MQAVRGGRAYTKRVAVVDEHDVFRRGVVAILDEDPFLRVVHESAEGPIPEADVIVASPRAAGSLQSTLPVLICWGPYDPPFTRPPDCAMAVIERDRLHADELLAVVRALAAGLRVERRHNNHGSADELDSRHRRILQMLAEGADTRCISESLHYSQRTVKGLVRDIEEHLSANNRAEAVAKGIRLGVI